MFIEKIEQNIVKINFYANEEEVYIADLIKVGSSGKKGVLAQVVKIESPENNQNYNTATSKILFTVDASGKIANWQGNTPGNDFTVGKVEPRELLSITKTGNVQNPVLSGQLSCYPEIPVSLEAAFLENPSVIVADKESQKNDLLELLAGNLSEKNAKVILIDYNGEFCKNSNALVLKAGKEVKLPFDLGGIERLYNKTLSEISQEIRANIENIFSEIEDYLISKKVSFLPFKVFADAVKTESQGMPGLDLLSGNLCRLHRKGVFADHQREIIYLFNSLNSNNLVILDLSEIDKEWKPFFVDSIIRLNREKIQRKFFLLMDMDKYKDLDKTDYPDIPGKIFSQAVKSGIKPIISISHESGLLSRLLPEAENILVFQPQDGSKMTNLQPYLARIGFSDVLVSGKVTNNVPLYIKLPVSEYTEGGFFSAQSLLSQPETEFTRSFESSKTLPGSSSGLETEIKPATKPDELKEASPAQEYDQLQAEEEFPDGENAVEESTVEFLEEVCPVSDMKDGQAESVYFSEEEGDFSDPDPDLDESMPETSYNERQGEKTAYQIAMEELDSEFDEAPAKDGSDAYVSEDFPDESNLDYPGNEEIDEEDEESYYDSGEFQDESVLDYLDNEEDEESYCEPGEFQDESGLDYADTGAGEYTEDVYPESTGEFSDDDLKNFMDFDGDENTEKFDHPVVEEEPENIVPAGSARQASKKPQSEKIKPAKAQAAIPPTSNLPVYDVPGKERSEDSDYDLKEGDTVRHRKYGIGIIKKVIGYSEKKLCSIQFEDVGRRLLDPKIAELKKM